MTLQGEARVMVSLMSIPEPWVAAQENHGQETKTKHQVVYHSGEQNKGQSNRRILSTADDLVLDSIMCLQTEIRHPFSQNMHSSIRCPPPPHTHTPIKQSEKRLWQGWWSRRRDSRPMGSKKKVLALSVLILHANVHFTFWPLGGAVTTIKEAKSSRLTTC